jgi:hypothetical protein
MKEKKSNLPPPPCPPIVKINKKIIKPHLLPPQQSKNIF